MRYLQIRQPRGHNGGGLGIPRSPFADKPIATATEEQTGWILNRTRERLSFLEENNFLQRVNGGYITESVQATLRVLSLEGEVGGWETLSGIVVACRHYANRWEMAGALGKIVADNQKLGNGIAKLEGAGEKLVLIYGEDAENALLLILGDWYVRRRAERDGIGWLAQELSRYCDVIANNLKILAYHLPRHEIFAENFAHSAGKPEKNCWP